nr:hypothetical protein CFP56_13656 [Quercus suber]
MLYMANNCCSIETEPKTLNEGQLNRAREVAADVVQKMEPNEASTIFNEILSPQIKDQEREKEEKEIHEPVEKAQQKKKERKNPNLSLARGCISF